MDTVETRFTNLKGCLGKELGVNLGVPATGVCDCRVKSIASDLKRRAIRGSPSTFED